MIPYKKLVIESAKAIYFEITKVACTSINYLLIQKFVRPGEKVVVSSIHNDETLPRIWRMDEEQFSGYFKFAFVRNPMSRLRSCFRDKIKPVDFNEADLYEDGLYLPLKRYGDLFWPAMTFDEFATSVCQISDQDADPHFRSQHCFVSNSKNELNVDFLGRFETLGSDLRQLVVRLQQEANDFDIPHLNRQKRCADSEVLSDDCLKMVRERYSLDYRWFGYEESLLTKS